MSARESVAGFAIAVVLENGRWRCSVLDSGALTSLEDAVRQLRKVVTSGAVLALLAVDDEFFVVIRPSPSGTELFLSDASAAMDYEIAADVLDELDVPIPEDDDEGLWCEGDAEILADLGLPAEELEMVAADEDLYPDEQLRMVASRCGFADEFDEQLGRLE